MRDQAELARECLEVEKKGGDVIEHLKGRGFVSPRATWERLQINELGRGRRNHKGVIVVMEQKVTIAQKDRAVELALEGEDPIEYLRNCGSTNPSTMWHKIQLNLKQQNQEMYAQLREKYKPRKGVLRNKKTVEPAEEAPAVEKKPKITAPLMFDDLAAVGWKGKSGRFSYDSDHDYFDYDNGIDELSFSTDWWRDFLRDVVHASNLCGVDLGVDLRD